MKIINTKKRLVQSIALCMLFYCYAFNIPAVETPVSKEQEKAINDSAGAKKSAVAFLRWYKTNLHKANSFPLLTKDSKGYLMVDKKTCNDYLAYMSSSKLLSAKYISYWKTYLDDKATMLKKDKIKDDVPEGFDFDFVLITQEPEIVLNKIDSLTFTTTAIKGNTAVIQVQLPTDLSIDYSFEMRKTAVGWQIDYISTANYD